MSGVAVREPQADLREFGRTIARARLKAKLTQEDLAARTNISQSHISLIEQGQRGVSPDTLGTLAEKLDLPYGHLAELAGYIPHRRGEVTRAMTPDEADDTEQFLRLPRIVRQAMLAAGRVWHVIAPVEEVSDAGVNSAAGSESPQEGQEQPDQDLPPAPPRTGTE